MGEFFGSFDNSEILDADVSVDVFVEKSGKYIGVDGVLSGTVTVQCDRCLSDLSLPVDVDFKLSVKFGEEPLEALPAENGEREIVFVPEDDTDLDLSQTIYDYVCLSLPMQRVHPEGECDPETVRFLSVETDEAEEEAAAPVESPFAALKDLLK
ncbi:MAG: DUF177 domain-containing protein [Bacteroidales bacterium]|nr:DUF177 domain-containing protein [Bacteroidales bacterium]